MPLDYLTPAEVATLTGRSVPAVLRWIRLGQLKADRFGGRWLVRRSIAQAFQVPPAGNPAWQPGSQDAVDAARKGGQANAKRKRRRKPRA